MKGSSGLEHMCTNLGTRADGTLRQNFAQLWKINHRRFSFFGQSVNISPVSWRIPPYYRSEEVERKSLKSLSVLGCVIQLIFEFSSNVHLTPHVPLISTSFPPSVFPLRRHPFVKGSNQPGSTLPSHN